MLDEMVAELTEAQVDMLETLDRAFADCEIYDGKRIIHGELIGEGDKSANSLLEPGDEFTQKLYDSLHAAVMDGKFDSLMYSVD